MLQPDNHSPGRIRQTHPLRLIHRAISTEICHCGQKLFGSFIQKRHPISKADSHPCPHSNNVVAVDRE
jgi:hypothetical protein